MDTDTLMYLESQRKAESAKKTNTILAALGLGGVGLAIGVIAYNKKKLSPEVKELVVSQANVRKSIDDAAAISIQAAADAKDAAVKLANQEFPAVYKALSDMNGQLHQQHLILLDAKIQSLQNEIDQAKRLLDARQKERVSGGWDRFWNPIQTKEADQRLAQSQTEYDTVNRINKRSIKDLQSEKESIVKKAKEDAEWFTSNYNKILEVYVQTRTTSDKDTATQSVATKVTKSGIVIAN